MQYRVTTLWLEDASAVARGAGAGALTAAAGALPCADPVGDVRTATTKAPTAEVRTPRTVFRR